MVALASFGMISAGCGKEKQQGVPPADEWQAPDEKTVDPTVSNPVNPHAGQPAADNPHGGMGGGGNPHGGGTGGANPHAGVGGMPGNQPPAHGMGKPSGPIDESKFITGTISATAEVKSQIEAGKALFVTLQRYEPEAGGGAGSVIAATNLGKPTGLPAKFKLTEREVMSGQLTGEMVVTAWVDGDGEIGSKRPGDVVGSVRAVVPADKVEIKLDKVLE